MNNVKITIDEIKNGYVVIINWIVIHLGKNPKNGGRPASLKKFIIKVKLKDFEKFILITCFM